MSAIEENPCKHPNGKILSYCPDCDEWIGLTLALAEDEVPEAHIEGDATP